MNGTILIIISILTFLRVLEYAISRTNEVWMLEKGGVEKNKGLNNWLFILQIAFFISLYVESAVISDYKGINLFWLIVLLMVILVKLWCVRVQNSFWSVREIHLPRVRFIKTGPYKYVKKPEYWILAGELFAIPLFMNLYMTFSLFILLHFSLFLVQLPEQTKEKVS